MSIYDRLCEIAKIRMSVPALSYLGKYVTYKNLFSMVDSLSKNLKNYGVKRGDKIAIMAGNSVQFVVSILALYKIGAISFFVNDYDDPENYGIDRAIASCCNYMNLKGNYRLAIVIRDEDFGPFGTSVSGFFRRCRGCDSIKWSDSVIKFSDMIFDAAEHENSEIEENSIIFAKYTKKENKTYMISEKNIESAQAMLDSVFSTFKKNVAIASSFRKIGSVNFILFSLLNGGLVTIIPENYPVNKSIRIIDSSGANIVYADPRFYVNILKMDKKPDLDKVRFFIMPGQHMNENFYSDFRQKTGKDIIEGYDVTGATGLIAINDIEKPLEKSSGKIFSQIAFKVTGNEDSGAILNGTLLIKSDTVAGNTDPDGYFNTMDSVTVNEDSFVFIKNEDQQIINGTIFSYEDVEGQVKKSGLVKDCAAVLSDGKYSKEIKLFIPAENKGQLEKLKEYCRKNMPYYLVPSSYDLIEKIPRSPSGKIIREELK